MKPADPHPDTVAGISAEAVKAKTGKTWAEWLKALDAEGCRKMTHKEIVAVVGGKFGVGDWWQQMVTVGYEQARGLRQKHQKPEGFQVSASKTLAAPVETVFKAWHDARARKKWLAEPIAVSKATPGKSLRLKWGDGKSSADVNLYVKGEAKTQVTVQHSKLKSAKEAAAMKKFWGEALNALKASLEG
ncbi:MAG: hypothetical protein HYZ49_07660 [Chloroflexi bacterium]|nr:hypothetical protein [Chloroflexota bacterium]